MKKFMFILVLLILLIPFVVNGQTVANRIEIDTEDIRTDVTAIHDTDLPAVKTDTGNNATAIAAVEDTTTAIHERLIDAEIELADIHDTDLPAVKTDTGNNATAIAANTDTSTVIHERLIDVEIELADVHDTDLPAVKTDTGNIRGTDVPAIVADTEEIQGDTDAILVDLYAATKIATTTEELNQAAAAYTLFTGTTADVILESLSLRNANIDCSDDATFTGISIHTDDVTTTDFIEQAEGVKANLTAEAQIVWTGSAIIKVDTIIQMTIHGDNADANCEPDIMVTYRSTGTGTGTLVP